MGEEDVVNESSHCDYCKSVRDCDGDFMDVCTYDGACGYKSCKRDCDGDNIAICNK